MKLSGINLNLLVAFDALMAERSVTRAAIRIGRTQPAMSAALARLRALLRDELFVYGQDGLQPTRRALDLAAPLSQALEQIRTALDFTERFEPAAFSESFRVGLSDVPGEALVPRLVELMARLAPSAALQVSTIIAREETEALLDSGAIDAAVSVALPPASRLSSEWLHDERFVSVLRRAHPLADAPLSLDAFLALRHVLVSPEGDQRGLVDIELDRLALTRRVGLSVPQHHLVPRVVAGSEMVATVLESTIRLSRHADLLAIHAPPLALPAIPFFLHWHRRNADHPAQRWLRARIVEAAGAWGRAVEPVLATGPA